MTKNFTNKELFFLDLTISELEFLKETLPKDPRTLLEDRILRTVVLKAVENVGEASNRLTKDLKDKYKQIPWDNLYLQRNLIVHDFYKYDVSRGFRYFSLLIRLLPEFLSIRSELSKDTGNDFKSSNSFNN